MTRDKHLSKRQVLPMTSKSVKLTINPTPEQVQLLQDHINAAQFSYNYCLEHLIDIDEIKASKGNKNNKISWHPPDSKHYQVSSFELEKRLNAIKDKIAPWNKENSQYAFKSGARDVAYDVNRIISRVSLSHISDADLPQPVDEIQINKKGVSFQTSKHGMRSNGRYFNLPKIGPVRINAGQDRLRELMQVGGITSSARLRKEDDRWTLRVYVNEAHYYSY